MKFNYRFERKDLIDYLKESNRKYNYICLVIFTLFYFGACLDLLSSNATAVLISYVVSILILFSLLKLVTIIFTKLLVKRNDKTKEFVYGTYHVELTENALKEEINGVEYTLNYEDIYRISKHDKWFILYPKNSRTMYLFIRKLFDKSLTYDKALNTILRHYEKRDSKDQNSVQEIKRKEEKPVRNKKKNTQQNKTQKRKAK